MTKTQTFTNRYTANMKSGNICELPDGSVADLSMIPSLTTDLFFNNEVFGYEGMNVGGMISESINRCDIDLKKELYWNIFIIGGNAKIKNFQQEIINDLKNRMVQVSGDLKRVEYEGDSQDLVWQGAAIEAMLDPNMEGGYWAAWNEYEDEGPRLLYRLRN